MIHKIQIKFSKPKVEWNKTFNKDFMFLLSSYGNVNKISNSSLFLGNKKLFPTTDVIFDQKAISVSFNNGLNIQTQYQTEGLVFGFNLGDVKNRTEPLCIFKILKDKVGSYCEYKIKNNTYYLLTISQLLQRFRGHLKEVNHTGINFSPSEIPENNYLQFKKKIAQNSYLVRYPTGEE